MPWYYNQSNERIEVTAKQLLSLAKNGEFAPDTRIEISEGNIIPARKVRITNSEGNRTKLSFWYYFNDRDERINITFPQLVSLVENSAITPDTRVEISEGNVIPAKNVRRTDGAKLPFWCYFNERDEQIAVTFQLLQQLARSETITRETRVITSDGRTCNAGDVDGLSFPKQFFCTNCGNAVAEKAPGCMSCGAKPLGHKKFCRQCGVGINSEQVVCLKCGVVLKRSPVDMCRDWVKSLMLGLQTSGTPLAAPQKQRIYFWTICCIVSFVLYTVISISNISDRIDRITAFRLDMLQGMEVPTALMQQQFTTGMYQTLIGIAYMCCFYFYLLRLWEEVPREFARTTPTKAALLSFIPLFNWYWWFVAFSGLHKDMNKAMESYGHTTRFGLTPIRLLCVGWVLLVFIYCVFALIFSQVTIACGARSVAATEDEVRAIVETVRFFAVLLAQIQKFAILLNAVLTALMCLLVCKNVIKFIDIKSSFQMDGGNPVMPQDPENKTSPMPIIIACVVGIAILCLVSFAFTGGSSSSTAVKNLSSPVENPSLLAGKWELRSGQQYEDGGFGNRTPVFIVKFEFLKDGTGIVDGNKEITWKVEGPRLYITAGLWGAVVLDYTISGSTLTLTDDEGRTARYRRR